MAEDLSFLEAANDGAAASALIADVASKVATMRQLERRMVEAEAVFEEAKKQFEQYKATTVVAAFTNAGISQLQDTEGHMIRLDTKYYCNPNKNDEDRAKIAAWLTSIGGQFLLKHEGKVDGAQLDKLREAGIPFADKTEVNTASLKAFLKGQLGLNGGTAQLKMEDIPDCVHFVTAFDIVTE